MLNRRQEKDKLDHSLASMTGAIVGIVGDMDIDACSIVEAHPKVTKWFEGVLRQVTTI
jgi:hypothetical protein